jgi:hypothetical protein
VDKLILRKFLAVLMLVIFILTSIPRTYAQTMVMPAPGTMAKLSRSISPLALQGLKVFLDDPLRLDFILDQGDQERSNLRSNSDRLIRYFLAALTVPQDDLWVNLSPYEKDRIIPHALGKTIYLNS